jgi:uncharacterized protein (DUF4415 family)
MKDSDINYSDAPGTDAEFWKEATVNVLPVKVPVTLRLSPAVLQWYKEQVPRGYQTLINAVLEEYMQRHKGEAQR